MASRAHLDQRMLDGARAALDWWAGQCPARPTSSLTGGGAIAAAEQAILDVLGLDGYALALPNGTSGLRTALKACGVVVGDEVLVSALDWPAASSAVESIGATAVPVDVDDTTLTIDPIAAARARSDATRAVIATHLHGVPVDVPALRDNLGEQIPVIEDAAQAFGAVLDRQPVGCLGDMAVFSLGPGKPISAGELGVLVTNSPDLHRKAVRHSQHPLRQMLSGIEKPDADNLANRAAPLSAVMAAYQLQGWKVCSADLRAAEQHAHLELSALDAHGLLRPGMLAVPGQLPLLLHDPGIAARPPIGSWIASSATVHPQLPRRRRQSLQELAERAGVLQLTALA